jgi:hypothetical protein
MRGCWDSGIKEYGPVLESEDFGLFLQVNLFYRWFDMWVGLYLDDPKDTIHLCVLGFGVKFRYVKRGRL